MGLLELQQGQKIKKIGRREIPEPEKSKSWPSGNSASPKNQKIGRREIPQAQKIKK